MALIDQIAALCPGGRLPDSYLLLDTETSSEVDEDCRIVQLGMIPVIDRKLQTVISEILDWPGMQITPKCLGVHHISMERVKAAGLSGPEYFKEVVPFINDYLSTKMVVGHNIVSYDLPVVEQAAALAGVTLVDNLNRVFDTGLLAKAHLMHAVPKLDETLEKFWLRLMPTRIGGWSLARCRDVFDLSKVVPEDAHDASVDCKLTHYTLEAFRSGAKFPLPGRH